MSRDRSVSIFPLSDSLIASFFRHVQKTDGCWLWTGRVGRGGYGSFWCGSGNVGAHRASLIIHRREAIPAGMLALHRCDNPPCVNPDHLWVGTHAENMRDAFVKGRLPTVKTPIPGSRNSTRRPKPLPERLKEMAATRGCDELPLGVRKRDSKFEARIVMSGKRVSLGRFSSPEAAHEAYRRAVKEVHGIEI